MAVDLVKLKEKFFTDPDWAMMEELIRSYIDPLASSLNINPKMSNDEIATEVRGRQIAYESLDTFLSQTGVLKPRKEPLSTSFK